MPEYPLKCLKAGAIVPVNNDNDTEKLKLLVDTCNDLIEKYSYQMETHAKTLGAYVVDEYMLEWDNFVDIVHDIGEDLKG